MNSTRFARYFALPIVSAGIIGAAALGLAGAASAATTDVQQPNIVATPNVKAHPAPDAMSGLALAPRRLPPPGSATGIHPLIPPDGSPPRK